MKLNDYCFFLSHHNHLVHSAYVLVIFSSCVIFMRFAIGNASWYLEWPEIWIFLLSVALYLFYLLSINRFWCYFSRWVIISKEEVMNMSQFMVYSAKARTYKGSKLFLSLEGVIWIKNQIQSNVCWISIWKYLKSTLFKGQQDNQSKIEFFFHGDPALSTEIK